MTPSQLEHFRQKLAASRAELLRELDAIAANSEGADDREGDQVDHSNAEFDRDFATRNRARVSLLLGEVDRALARIENGTYGICEDTGRPIGLKRLEAQPTATLSVEALEQRERGAT